jgi:hypothetical protein
MKYIALIAVITLLVLELSGAIPRSSVGGPMTIALVFLIAAVAVGIHEAWLKKLGVGGWILSIVTALVGGLVGASLGSMVLETVQGLLGLEGALAETRHPLLYVSLVGMMLLALLGSWIALRIVDRMR